ncbi:DEAD/DEAH box helicase [Candidatus Nanosalina sp. VS9-1]|uniref:DEAD/DEAH box helicase n=1 Tax=Candidatus Nanosalina sp. VS9-1 TaxID=3388566 RepID=UPI0039DFF698
MTVLRKDKIESRAYQEVIAASASDRNTLVVLPTGLGKTIIAVMVASIKYSEDSKILMLAPTKPLVEQHKKTFQEFLDVDEDQMQVMTGEIRPDKRYELWEEKNIFFATPQVVENDLISAEVPVEAFSLVIFDEAHRATGEYSYVFINEKMNTQNLALTASPGGSKEKIMEVSENLGIENFEVRTEDDPDVEPYIQEREVNWLNVELDDRFEEARNKMEASKRTQLKKLKKLGQLDSTSDVNKTDLLKLRGEISSKLSKKDDPQLYSAISRVATALKISQAIELLETQGVSQAYEYVQGLENDDSKAASRVLQDDDMQRAINLITYLKKEDVEHPKTEKVVDILDGLEDSQKALVFTEYRSSVEDITRKLEEEDFSAAEFVGQSGDTGMSQTEQIELLEEFSDGDHQVVVSTSIGEEGLDIPAVDYVIFYEPVPSSIRDIQRMGRTGRQESGEVFVLIAENTRDEGYYWSAHHKKKKMNKVLQELKEEGLEDTGQSTLEGYSSSKTTSKKEKNSEASTKSEKSGKDDEDKFDSSELTIYADDRENSVAKNLSRMDTVVKKQRLDVADFLVSDRTAVERKEAEDFVDSVLDSRLFEQVQSLQQFERPVIIVEGDDLYSHRDIHPNAIRGALATLAIDYGMPIIWSADEKETSKILEALAKREQEDKDREVSIRGEKSPKSDKQLQEFVVAGLPGVNTKIAERILNEFGSIQKVVNASEEELKSVEGIGDKKASTIRDLLTREY